ncbi:RHS repeat-associated core domain-containing protein [Thalassotalea nanhaiensis]|uniref:RHS repeat-associated core domain-containing protein n=1 Tax=Thalassotalea nanhaiensis TaxID=3065648 RepID=A0ABY9TPF1_9GAMM|nr:RHS repeat-associated core domain-containing protein [Colwelliaceae bacterium SQ345]
MRPIFYGSCHPITRLPFLSLIIFITILFSITANAGQPYHQAIGSLNGYEDEDKIANSGLEWIKRPKYKVSQTSPARINSWVTRTVSLNGWPTGEQGKIIWRFFAPDGSKSKEDSTRWTGSCWTGYYSCTRPGGTIEAPAFVADEIGLWRVETYDSSDGVETLISSEPFEVRGREMQITKGVNLTVYENDNSDEPLALKLIDYDHVSGTPNKLVTFEVIQRPKGKASGGLNYYYKEGFTGSKINSIEATTNFNGIARVFFESGSNHGTYIIKATSYWAPESPIEFQVTVKEGKDPNKEEDILTELLEPGRNLGKPKQCDALVGNPINVITGNKFQQEIDYQGKGFMPLEFIRYYNSHSNSSSGFGLKWSHSYSRYITSTTEEVNGLEKTVAKLYRDNGQVVSFYQDRKSWYPVHADVRSQLTLASKKWRYTTEQNIVEVYNQQGQLESITHIDGNVYTLEYLDDGKLQYVYSPNRSRLSFEYNSDDKIKRVFGSFDNYYRYYESNSGMLSFVQDNVSSKRYHYEDANYVSLLSGITDENGDRVSTWKYNDKRQAISSFNGNGLNQVNIQYHMDGSRTVTHADGKTTELLATAQLGLGLLTNVDGPTCDSGEEKSKSFTYDHQTNNILSKTVDGITTTFGNYDSNGNPGFVIEAYGSEDERRTDYTYDPRFPNRVTHIKRPSVSVGYKISHLTYDDSGHLLQQREQGYELNGTPLERVISYEYNGPLGQVSRIDGARIDVDDSYHFNYHPLDATSFVPASLKDVIGPDGSVLKTNMKFKSNGSLSSYTTANGLKVDNTYYSYDDTLETHTRTANNISRTTFFTYTSTKQIESITTGYGSDNATTINLAYDNTQRLIRVSNSLGDYIEFEFDANNNVVAENVYDNKAVLQQQIATVFDSYNNISQQISANQIVKSVHAADGRLIQQTDGNNVVNKYTYDDLKRLTTISNDTNGAEQSTTNSQNLINYDVHNNQTHLTDANGNTTEYEFDDLGNLLSENSPDRGKWLFTYDSAGNRLTAVDAKQQTFNYQYDAYNRLLLTDTLGTSEDVSYFYDVCSNGIGKLCRVLKGNTEVSYSYNGFGELASQTQNIGSITTTVSYSYDLQGRIKDITYPSGSVVSYSYDNAGNVQTVDLTQNGNTQNIINGAEYTFSGLLTNLNFANGLALNNTYDLAGRVTSLTNGPLNLLHSFDGAANIISQSTNQYSYDALNRLASASTNLGDLDYSYDKNSNRLTFTENSIQTQYGIAINSNIITSINTLIVNNDANGNRLNRNGQTLQYTPYNQLSQIANVAQYKYNGLGQRVQKALLLNTDIKTFVYGINGQLLAEMDVSGIVTDEHIYLGNMPIAVIKHKTAGSELFYVHSDHLNTPRAITKQDKTEVWQWQSDPFGKGLANNDVDLDGTTFDYNKRFPGQYYDGESGLHYNYYRDYDPTTGRYLQSDPIGLNGGMNTFGYVGGNPLMYTDPLGLARWKGRIEAVAGGEIVGGIAGRAILTSDCNEGKRWNVKVSFKAGGTTAGFPWSIMASKIELNDPYPTAKPINLIGDFSYSGVSVAALLGYGVSTIQIGQAYSASSGLVVGVDASWTDFTLGESSVTDAFETECGCER